MELNWYSRSVDDNFKENRIEEKKKKMNWSEKINHFMAAAKSAFRQLLLIVPFSALTFWVLQIIRSIHRWTQQQQQQQRTKTDSNNNNESKTFALAKTNINNKWKAEFEVST